MEATSAPEGVTLRWMHHGGWCYVIGSKKSHWVHCKLLDGKISIRRCYHLD